MGLRGRGRSAGLSPAAWCPAFPEWVPVVSSPRPAPHVQSVDGRVSFRCFWFSHFKCCHRFRGPGTLARPRPSPALPRGRAHPLVCSMGPARAQGCCFRSGVPGNFSRDRYNVPLVWKPKSKPIKGKTSFLGRRHVLFLLILHVEGVLGDTADVTCVGVQRRWAMVSCDGSTWQSVGDTARATSQGRFSNSRWRNQFRRMFHAERLSPVVGDLAGERVDGLPRRKVHLYGPPSPHTGPGFSAVGLWHLCPPT